MARMMFFSFGHSMLSLLLRGNSSGGPVGGHGVAARVTIDQQQLMARMLGGQGGGGLRGGSRAAVLSCLA